ncbi:MAG TPA: hypothetical protein VNN20_08270 [Thermodesulfobacteriota bacterium]|nr:hypothetical protein [Thermodesulfobacteriota bacterium]
MDKKVSLPLDDERYQPLKDQLKNILRRDPELSDANLLREFLENYKDYFGTRTSSEISTGTDNMIRRTVHYMVLSATDLQSFHITSRNWLKEQGYQLPPWDTESSHKLHRVIEYKGHAAAVVEWEPEKNITLDPSLEESEKNWVLAMAIGAGEKPEWSVEELRRFAAYLTMGRAEFSNDRELGDQEIAEKYEVPIEEVAYRRGLPDEIGTTEGEKNKH